MQTSPSCQWDSCLVHTHTCIFQTWLFWAFKAFHPHGKIVLGNWWQIFSNSGQGELCLQSWLMDGEKRIWPVMVDRVELFPSFTWGKIVPALNFLTLCKPMLGINVQLLWHYVEKKNNCISSNTPYHQSCRFWKRTSLISCSQPADNAVALSRLLISSPPIGLACHWQRFSCLFAFSFGQVSSNSACVDV